MNEEILEGLENEIISIIKFNNKLSSDTTEYKVSNEALCTLCDTYKNLLKTESEIESNEEKVAIENRKLEAEIENTTNQTEFDKKDKVWNWIFKGAAVCTTIAGIGVTIWGYKMGWRYELDKNDPEILTNTPGKESYKMLSNFVRKVF